MFPGLKLFFERETGYPFFLKHQKMSEIPHNKHIKLMEQLIEINFYKRNMEEMYSLTHLNVLNHVDNAKNIGTERRKLVGNES